MSALREFDPRRGEEWQAPKVSKAPKVAASDEKTLGGLATLGAADPAQAQPTDADWAYALDALRRAENVFSPDALADEAELMAKGVPLP